MLSRVASSDTQVRSQEINRILVKCASTSSPEEMQRLVLGIYFCYYQSPDYLELAPKLLLNSQLYLTVLLQTIKQKWFQLDRFRIDKYYHLLKLLYPLLETIDWLQDMPSSIKDHFVTYCHPSILDLITDKDLAKAVHDRRQGLDLEPTDEPISYLEIVDDKLNSTSDDVEMVAAVLAAANPTATGTEHSESDAESQQAEPETVAVESQPSKIENAPVESRQNDAESNLCTPTAELALQALKESKRVSFNKKLRIKRFFKKNALGVAESPSLAVKNAAGILKPFDPKSIILHGQVNRVVKSKASKKKGRKSRSRKRTV